MYNENGGGKDEEHPIRIWEIDTDRLKLMRQKLSDKPKLLSVAAGSDTCSIFKVPQTLIDINAKSYQPQIVSIGPFHHGQPHLQMIEEHKWQYLRGLVDRTQTKGMDLEDYLRAVQPLELEARDCYSETIPNSTDEFIEMMVLDGCFVIELFRKVGGLVKPDEYDPLITKLWIRSFLSRDLIKLENQIPFVVLQRLFNLTKMSGEGSNPTLAKLALYFFDYSYQRPDNVREKHANDNDKTKHLLHLLWLTFVPPEPEEKKTPKGPWTQVIPTISKLRRAGIKLKPWDADSFLRVSFKHGVIKMPTICIDDFMSSFLLNSVAFEQCHSVCSKHFTTYVTFLDCLINTPRDVGYLCDWNIIENSLGTDDEVATLFNDMGKDLSIDIGESYLAKIFDDVDRYYHNSWHVHLAGFMYTYFDTPWSFISALAALILLVLTVIQTVYTVVN